MTTKKIYAKHSRFEEIANKIQATVQRYWTAHNLPLGWRYAISPFMNQLKAEHREEFKQWIIVNRYVHQAVAAKTASRYLFPPLAANNLNEDAIAEAMYRLAHTQRFEHNRTRNERSAREIENNLIPRDAIPIRRPTRRKHSPPASEAS